MAAEKLAVRSSHVLPPSTDLLRRLPPGYHSPGETGSEMASRTMLAFPAFRLATMCDSLPLPGCESVLFQWEPPSAETYTPSDVPAYTVRLFLSLRSSSASAYTLASLGTSPGTGAKVLPPSVLARIRPSSGPAIPARSQLGRSGSKARLSSPFSPQDGAHRIFVSMSRKGVGSNVPPRMTRSVLVFPAVEREDVDEIGIGGVKDRRRCHVADHGVHAPRPARIFRTVEAAHVG